MFSCCLDLFARSVGSFERRECPFIISRECPLAGGSFKQPFFFRGTGVGVGSGSECVMGRGSDILWV